MKKGIKNLYYNKKKLLALISCSVMLMTSFEGKAIENDVVSTNITINNSIIEDNGFMSKIYVNDETRLEDVDNIVVLLPGSDEKVMIAKGALDIEKINIHDNVLLLSPIKNGHLSGNDNKRREQGIKVEQDILMLLDYLKSIGNNNDIMINLLGFSEGSIIIGSMLKENPDFYDNITFVNGAPNHSDGRVTHLNDEDLNNIENKNFLFVETVNNPEHWNKNMLHIIETLSLHNNVSILTNDSIFDTLDNVTIDYMDSKYKRHGDAYKVIMDLDIINACLFKNNDKKK